MRTVKFTALQGKLRAKIPSWESYFVGVPKQKAIDDGTQQTQGKADSQADQQGKKTGAPEPHDRPKATDRNLGPSSFSGPQRPQADTE
jgi:hypothetical protein